MVDEMLARAALGGDDALPALVVASALDDRASVGRVRDGLLAIARSSSPLGDDALWLSLRLSPDPGARPWPGMAAASFDAAPAADGLVKAFAIVGPFQDTAGDGVTRHEGPEAPGHSFADMSAHYAWGVYDVPVRRALPSSASARGVPLDLYVFPRSETCTYLASRVTVPEGQRPFVIRVASTGAVRLIWDAQDVAVSEEVHARMVLDRLAVRVDTSPGDHLLAVKVCTAAAFDEGRARVRFTDDQYRPLALGTSSDLRRLPQNRASFSLTEAPVSEALAQKPAGLAETRHVAVTAAPKVGSKSGDRPKPRLALSEDRHRTAESPGQHGMPDPPLPQGITRVSTALERALALGGASPTMTQALCASILRVLGGADDARSPRAPGLLDGVARTPGATPDVLAMAGWISPFGANRSGWLNLAREQALSLHDNATASFAERRLAASRLGGHYNDWAMASAAEEPFAKEGDPEARLIRALVKKQLGSAGFARAALEDLLDIEGSQKERTPISVLSELFTLSRSEPALHHRLARRLAQIAPDARGYGYVDAFRSLGPAAVEGAASDSIGSLTSADELLRIGHELLADSRYAMAREVFTLATYVAPNRASAFAGLSAVQRAILPTALRAAGALPLVGGYPEQIQRADLALLRAHDLEPADASLTAEVLFRRGDTGTEDASSRKARRDEQYIVPPEVFLRRAVESPAKKGEVVDRQLHWVRVVTYHPDKRISQLMHYSREIVVEPRTDSEVENVPAEGDETELLFARVHKKDGTVLLPEEQSSGGKKPLVRWPELKTGDVVEVAVRSWTAGPVGLRGDAPFWFIDYAGSTDTHPILSNEVVVDSPEDAPLAIDVLHGKADRVTTTRAEGRVVTRYTWDKPPAVIDEPLAPKLSETLPVVVGSTFGSWAAFREWYRAAVKGFTEPDDQVRKLAAELTRDKKTREDKLKAIFEFVADDIRYVNYVSGEWWLPNRPQELLARRQGDCDDKAMLLITLLKAVGIEATEVLVQTRYTAQPSLLRSERAAIPVFDHGIAYLPAANGKPGTWLDATSPESRLGPLPSMDARAVAFFVDEGPAKTTGTPASTPAEHGIDGKWTITLSPSGSGELAGEERHTGDAAWELRTSLKQPDARVQWVEQYLASGWFPTVQVTSEVSFQPDLPKGVATLAYSAHSDGFARREGQELAVPIAEASTLTAQLAPLVKRTLPVVLPPRLAPGHETRTFTIIAPAGYSFADLPPNGDVPGGEFGKAHVEFARAVGKNAVVVRREVVFDLSTIPLDKYAKWRAWLQRVDGLMHRTVRLVPDVKPQGR
jgi:hypothetical protein